MRARHLLIACLLVLTRAAADEVGEAATPYAAAADRRGEEQTFLTFPEWFLVFSPAEYATFVRLNTPDHFCFWGHIGQLWGGYASVIHQTTARHEPTNWGYHLMIVVISVSTTIEYAVRSGYETLVGRISAALARGRTAEDDYGAQVAQQYVDFIRVRPWYEFDFWARLRGLWMTTAPFGPDMLRKWERKYALTSEYTVKALYGWVITQATHSIYDTPIESTTVVVQGASDCQSNISQVSILRPVSATQTLLALPRYEAFMEPAVELARCGAQFEEIAGNRTVIVASVIGALGRTAPFGMPLMTRQPIITEPGRERLVMIVPIARLATVLRDLKSEDLTLEHLFDY